MPLSAPALPGLPARLLAARRATGKSQTFVAAAVGIDASHYGRLERGHMAPTVQTLYALAQVLDLDDLAEALRPYVVHELVA